jgi:mannose-1-phosphate guanylyltransferase
MHSPLLVVLSGGTGSCLWPISRKTKPKQYLPLFGGQSLFQLTLRRNCFLGGSPIVVGNRHNYALSRADLSVTGLHHYTEIIEATPRNTAAAIAFAALSAGDDTLLLVTPSDLMITQQVAYETAVAEAIRLAADGHLVTFGLVPTRPETGYGYIEADGNAVLSFREKPDATTAEAFCDNGRFYWNSGIFCFRAGRFLEELARHAPDVYLASVQAWEARHGRFLPEAESLLIPSQSVDFAVMERSRDIRVVPAELGWADLGNLESLWEYFRVNNPQKFSPNVSFVQDNLVLGSTRHVEFIGVKNLIIVETPDALLVIDKSNSQAEKHVYERLETEWPELVEYLR